MNSVIAIFKNMFLMHIEKFVNREKDALLTFRFFCKFRDSSGHKIPIIKKEMSMICREK